jgi:hypothetical protein
MIGKRKRDTAVASRKKIAATETEKRQSTGDDNDQANHHDIFRQFFESQFKPIEKAPATRNKASDSDTAEDGESESGDAHSGSEWDGLSENEGQKEQQAVEVIAYDNDSSQKREEDELARAEYKSFMVSSYLTISLLPPHFALSYLNI